MTETVVRVSALAGWPDCNRRGAARLFRAEIEAAGFRLRQTVRGIGAAIGTSVHKAAEVTLGEKARAGALPPATVAFDAAAGELKLQLAEGEITFDGPRGITHTAREAEGQTLAMTALYHRIVAPQIEPVIVEERLEAEIDGLVLSGQPDVVAREPHAIRDLKTGVRRGASWAPQVGGYSLLARSNGLDIDAGRIDYLQRVATGKPQPEPVTEEVALEVAETAAANILKHIATSLETFRHGDPVRRIAPGDPWAFQANPASNLCSERWCAAWGSEFCHEWKK